MRSFYPSTEVDSTFPMHQSQKFTAVNQDGFEVDIIRQGQTGDDPHPIKLGDGNEDFWVLQAHGPTCCWTRRDSLP
jgi:hypothetical protein